MSWQGLESTDQALANKGIQWIDWNMLCGDAGPLSVRPTTSESMMAYMDGSQKYFPETTVKVVLMHDTAGKELTVQTLPQIIEYFKKSRIYLRCPRVITRNSSFGSCFLLQ